MLARVGQILNRTLRFAASPTPWTRVGRWRSEAYPILAAALVLDERPDTARPAPEPDSDQLTWAVGVGLCLTLAAVLIVPAFV